MEQGHGVFRRGQGRSLGDGHYSRQGNIAELAPWGRLSGGSYCTIFASQALYVGGWTMVFPDYIPVVGSPDAILTQPGTQTPAGYRSRGDRGWASLHRSFRYWYCDPYAARLDRQKKSDVTDAVSWSFSDAPTFAEFCRYSGRAHQTYVGKGLPDAELARLQAADIVQLEGEGWSIEAHHTMIVGAPRPAGFAKGKAAADGFIVQNSGAKKTAFVDLQGKVATENVRVWRPEKSFAY